MCVIFFALGRHPQHRLLLIANRDEFYDRPTENLHRWPDLPNIRAGRDLAGGGTWLGVTDDGRFAAVTNYRDPKAKKGTISRGKLVADFLKTDASPSDYLEAVSKHANEFSGFNLLVGEINALRNETCYFSNRGGEIMNLDSGFYGLSNALLNTPWPKVERGKRSFSDHLEETEISNAVLYDILADETRAADEELPDTGIGYEREKAISSLFIRTPIYGTRSSSIISIDDLFRAEIEEKVFI